MRGQLSGSCWHVQIADLREPVPLEHAIPPLIQLDSAWLDISNGWRKLTEVPGSLPSVHRTSYWHEEGDTLELGWSTGFSGWLLSLPMGGDTLRGTAAELTDAGEGIRATATAARISCYGSVPERYRRRHLTAPAVMLQDGYTLKIGDGLDTARPAVQVGSDRVVAILTPPAGVFGGADSVRVRLGAERRIVAVHLQFPDTSVAARVVRHFEAHFGSPEEAGALAGYGMLWNDREVWLHVSTGRTLNRLEIQMVDPKEVVR